MPRDDTSARFVGRVLASTREAAGLTQEDVAGRAHVDRSYLSDVERGQASLSVDRFLKICRGLGVPAPDVIAQIERLLGSGTARSKPGDLER